MSDDRAPDDLLERVLDLALYAPVGAALALREGLPRHVRQGRQAMENRVQLARFIGQLTVQTGQRELQKRIDQRRAQRASTDEPTSATTAGPGASADGAGAPDQQAGATPGPGTAGHDAAHADVAAVVPTAIELPISDYESVPAINVVERLRTMRPDEIELIRRFEAAHRSRRTILAKIDQLQQRQLDAEHTSEQP